MKKVILSLILVSFFPIFAFADSYDDYSEQPAKPSVIYPNFEGEVLVDYTADFLSKKKNLNLDDKKSDGKLNIDARMKFNLTQGISVNTNWVFKPIRKRLYEDDIHNYDSTYNRSRNGYEMGGHYSDDYYGKESYMPRQFHWDDYGLIIKELSLDYRNQDLAAGIGKISPTFGRAFDKTRYYGIYGTLMPEEYALTEKYGMYASAILGNFAEIRANTFFDDDSALSKSLFKDRGRDKSHGGAGNTNSLKNYSITIDGKIMDFAYNVGFRYLSAKGTLGEDEKGYVFGLEHLKEFYNGFLRIIPSFEIAYFENFDGSPNRDVYYATGVLPIIYGNWNILFSSTIKYDDEKGYKDYTSYLNQISMGYRFSNGFMIDAARKWHKEAEKISDSSMPVVSSGMTKNVRKYNSWAIMVSYLYKF